MLIPILIYCSFSIAQPARTIFIPLVFFFFTATPRFHFCPPGQDSTSGIFSTGSISYAYPLFKSHIDVHHPNLQLKVSICWYPKNMTFGANINFRLHSLCPALKILIPLCSFLLQLIVSIFVHQVTTPHEGSFLLVSSRKHFSYLKFVY